jgi:hypothetical protein
MKNIVIKDWQINFCLLKISSNKDDRGNQDSIIENA